VSSSSGAGGRACALEAKRSAARVFDPLLRCIDALQTPQPTQTKVRRRRPRRRIDHPAPRRAPARGGGRGLAVQGGGGAGRGARGGGLGGPHRRVARRCQAQGPPSGRGQHGGCGARGVGGPGRGRADRRAGAAHPRGRHHACAGALARVPVRRARCWSRQLAFDLDFGPEGCLRRCINQSTARMPLHNHANTPPRKYTSPMRRHLPPCKPNTATQTPPSKKPQPPPAVDVSTLEPVQQLLASAPALTPWEAFRLLLSHRAALAPRPDAATAKAAFAAAWRCDEPQTAQDAAVAFLSWCGAPPLAAGEGLWVLGL